MPSGSLFEGIPLSAEIIDLGSHPDEQQFGRFRRDAGPRQHLDLALLGAQLAAEADGAERQRWINAALAWIELTRLRVSGRERSGVEETV